MRRTRLIALGAACVTILVALFISAHVAGGQSEERACPSHRSTIPIHRESYRPI